MQDSGSWPVFIEAEQFLNFETIHWDWKRNSFNNWKTDEQSLGVEAFSFERLNDFGKKKRRL